MSGDARLRLIYKKNVLYLHHRKDMHSTIKELFGPGLKGELRQEETFGY